MIQYFYDPSGNKGLMWKVSGSTQNVVYNFDNMGRNTQITNSVLGNQYITNLQYSSDGKLIKQINPTGVITENNYTEFGALSEIKCNGQRVWKLNSLRPSKR